MKLSTLKSALLGALLLLTATASFGQAALSQIGPNFYSAQFNQWRVPVDIGTSASGAGTITLYSGMVSLPDGRTFSPFSVFSRITISDANGTETVTPSAVAGCSSGQLTDTCQITATFANAHGRNALVSSGSFGLDEAALAANAYGGGVPVLDSSFGGTTATITAAPWLAQYPKVVISDQRSAALSYWRAAPGLTNIAAPTALTTASTLTTATTGGTIATAQTPRFCITAVDFFGGETSCSADAASTATLVDGATATNSYTITAAGVPTGTGIVGYRVYVSATGGTTQTETLEPAANLSCAAAPLSPLVGTCGAGSAILITALPATTAAGPPAGTSGAATAINSAHTTVVAQNVGQLPTMMPFVDTAAPGFFPVTVTSATTLVVGFDVMGELPYPAGFFNSPGSKWRICGGGVATPSAATVAGTWTIRIGPRQNSAGTSTQQIVVPYGFVASNQWTAALSHFDFCTDVTTTATGTSGTMEGAASSFSVVVAAGNDGAGTDTTVGAFNAVSSAIDLTQQGVVDVTYVQTAASWTLPQLRYLSITRL